MPSTLHQTAPASPEPASAWPAIAADLVTFCAPEDFPRPPGFTPAMYWEMRGLMVAAGVDAILAASP
jgi:hypothetical protein